jgi:hypothetical protein
MRPEVLDYLVGNNVVGATFTSAVVDHRHATPTSHSFCVICFNIRLHKDSPASRCIAGMGVLIHAGDEAFFYSELRVVEYIF